MWPVALMGAATLLQGYGNYKANMDQSAIESQNASYYRQQAEAAREAGAREENIYRRKSDVIFGNQVGAYAAGNVDIGSGSAADVLAQSRVESLNERSAIRTQTDMRVNLALLRASAADQHANALSNPTNNLLQFGGTALAGAGQMSVAASKYPGSGTSPNDYGSEEG